MSGASLQSLPGELVDEIIQYTLPEGFESFALSCKDIYNRARDRTIQRHNALKRRFRTTRIYMSEDDGEFGNLFRLMHELALDPVSAAYIEYLDLWDPHGTSIGQWPDLPDNEALERVKDMVFKSSLLRYTPSISPEEVWHTMMEENQYLNESTNATTIVFLLSFLPNLTTLQLDYTWALGQRDNSDPPREYAEELPDWYRLLERLVASGPEWNALGKLKTILPFMPEGYESRAALENIEQFMPLKSLEELYLVSCIATEPEYYTGLTFHYNPRNGWTSDLRRVELAYCCMDAEGVASFLSNIRALEIFRYSHQTKWHGCQHDWNPGTFIEAIARHSGQTIRELAITVENLFGDIINGASSFFSFPKLVKLECDILIFRGPAVESGQRRGMDPYVHPGETPWNEDDIPCIGSMLPTSIEEVQLNTDFPKPDEHSLNALLKNCREQRAARLTRLEKFIIRQFKDDTAKPMAERAGVDFEVYDHPGQEPVIRSLMPEWKREFDERVGGVVLNTD